MFEYVDTISIIVSALLAVAIGSAWYSPLLFGPLWMRSLGKSIADLDVPQREMFIATARAFLLQLVFFAAVAAFVSLSIVFGIPVMQFGLLLFVIIAVNMLSGVVWEGRSFTYVLVHAGYVAVILFGGMAVMRYWPW